MHQGIQGKEVTFKDVLILFFKRFERIFIVALAFAVVFAAYGAMRGYRAISSENRQKQLDDYQIKLDEYNDSTQKLRDTIDDSQKQLDDLVQYTENSIYYNLDPYNEAVSELVFYVDTGYQIAPSQYYQNPNKTGEIVSAYCDAYRSAGLYEEVSSLLGEDVDVKYIDELLTIERAGDTQIKDSVGNVTVKHSDGNAGVVVIRARAQDEQTASNITSYVFNYLKENLGNVIAEHTTTVLSDSTMVVVDEELENLHKETREEMAELEETIKTNQAELATLERDMPVEPTFSMMSVVKKAILFGIIGGILGGIVICLWVLLAYLADNRLEGAYQTAKLYNLELFAVVNGTKKKRRPLFYKLIDNLEGNALRQNFESADKAAEYTAVSVKALAEGQKVPMTVAVVSTRKDEEVTALCSRMEQCSDADVSYQACPAMLEETESMKKVLDADAVILVEHSGVSLISEINRQIIRLEKSGKKILGILLAE